MAGPDHGDEPFAAPCATADVVHTVAPGESLWSIAAADGLSPYRRTLSEELIALNTDVPQGDLPENVFVAQRDA